MKSTYWLVVLTLVIGLVVGYITFNQVSTNEYNESNRKSQLISATELDYKVEKLTFCIDRNIAPCNDVTISNWNEQNLEDTFILKSFEDIVNEVADQLRVEQL